MDSILQSIKKLLGIAAEYDAFDIDITIHINSVFSILTQLGVEMVRTYVYLKVRLLFDPPTSSAAIDSASRLISELEWRLNVAAENIGKEETNNEK